MDSFIHFHTFKLHGTVFLLAEIKNVMKRYGDQDIGVFTRVLLKRTQCSVEKCVFVCVCMSLFMSSETEYRETELTRFVMVVLTNNLFFLFSPSPSPRVIRLEKADSIKRSLRGSE